MKKIQRRALACFMGFATLSVFNVNHSFAASNENFTVKPMLIQNESDSR
jgi:hypothetical protein